MAKSSKTQWPSHCSKSSLQKQHNKINNQLISLKPYNIIIIPKLLILIVYTIEAQDKSKKKAIDELRSCRLIQTSIGKTNLFKIIQKIVISARYSREEKDSQRKRFSI